MSSIVAWKTGARTYSFWHICGDDIWVTLCGLAVPTRPLDNVSRVRGKDQTPTCAKCLLKVSQRTKDTIRLVRA